VPKRLPFLLFSRAQQWFYTTPVPRRAYTIRKYLRPTKRSFLHLEGDLPCFLQKNNNFHTQPPANILSVLSVGTRQKKKERGRVCVCVIITIALDFTAELEREDVG
jgi:hypothetical protein